MAMEEVRLEKAAEFEGVTFADVDTHYAQVFRNYGIDFDELGIDESAARMRRSAVCSDLAMTLDDWAIVRRKAGGSGGASWKKLLAVAHAADPNELRGRLRIALERVDRDVFRELADSDEVATLPSSTVVLLADALGESGEKEGAFSLLRMAIRMQPGDFWINYSLAHHLSDVKPPRVEEWVQFSRVTLALRRRARLPTTTSVSHSGKVVLWTRRSPRTARPFA